MRGYGKISPRFWNGPTGKQIRALGVEAQLVAVYLMTSPSSSMTGLYYLPIPVLSHETGIPFEGASKALRSLTGVHFCAYDEGEEVVWIPEMARHQVGDTLKSNDNRVAGVIAALEPYLSSRFYAEFLDRYGEAFSLRGRSHAPPKRRGFEAPSKPLRSQEQDQEQEQEQEQEADHTLSAPAGPRSVDVPRVEVAVAAGRTPEPMPPAPDPDAFLLADLLREVVVASKPNHREGDEDSWRMTRRAWARTMAKMLRRRPRSALEAAIRWVGANAGQPYAFAVESAKAFDEKLDRIEVAMVRPPPGRIVAGNGGHGGGLTPMEIAKLDMSRPLFGGRG